MKPANVADLKNQILRRAMNVSKSKLLRKIVCVSVEELNGLNLKHAKNVNNMEEKKPKILYIVRDDGGCGFFRCLQPAKYIQYMGLAETKTVMKFPTKEDLLWADLVVMQESGTPQAMQNAQFLLQNKIPYIVEFDDFVHHVSPRNEGGFGAWNPSTLFIHRAMELLRGAFGATVSTPQLAREYFPYNPFIYVVPNYLDKFLWDNPVVRRGDDKIRIGWCGGNAHADDLFMVSKVIERLVKEFDGKVIFETMGMTANELRGVFPMPHTSTDSCSHCGFEGTLHHFPGEGLESYPSVLAGRGWDIAIAPVINNAFGNCKSDLKLKEYAASGLATVASDVVPYREAQKDGAKVLLAETYEEWYNSLRSLIIDKILREDLAGQNKEWVARYWIQDNAQHIFEAYTQIIERAKQVFSK